MTEGQVLLADLPDRGIISDEDFEAKRKICWV